MCIDIATRTVYFAGVTDHPSGVWTTQAARNLLLHYGHQLADAQALVRDRASQFIDAFDEIFRTERMKILKTAVRTPAANALPNAGSAPCDASSSTAPSSGTAANSTSSSPTTSITTTRTGPTVHSTSGHPSPPTHQTSQTVTSKSRKRPAVTDSSTSTEMPPDQIRHSFRHPHPSKLRSASVISGRSTCRRSTPSWWPKTMISRSFERPDRTVSRASDARNRYKIRYTTNQHRPPSRQVNDHGRVSGTHRAPWGCLWSFAPMVEFSAGAVVELTRTRRGGFGAPGWR